MKHTNSRFAMRMGLPVLLLFCVRLTAQCFPPIGLPPADSICNTGSNRMGGTLNAGARDLSWTIATGSINASYQPAIVMGPIPGTYYRSPWTDCQWISHSQLGFHDNPIDEFYKLTIDLPCKNACGKSFDSAGTYCLSLDLFADNAVEEVYINSKPQSSRIDGIPVSDPLNHKGFEDYRMLSFTLCNDWKAGRNTLVIHVRSGPRVSGLLVQASVKPLPGLRDTSVVSLCPRQTLQFGKQLLDRQGFFTEKFKSYRNCDSFAVMQVIQETTIHSRVDTSICFGEQYLGYNSSGTYTNTFKSLYGCDSIRTLNLTVRPLNRTVITRIILPGQSFSGYANAGNYTDTFRAYQGCDSIRLLQLKVCPYDSLELSAPDTVCASGGKVLLGSRFSVAGHHAYWTGQHIIGSAFDPSKADTLQQFSLPYKAVFTYTNLMNNCVSRDSLYIVVQNPQRLKLQAPSPWHICEADTAKMQVASLYETAIEWYTGGSGHFTRKNDFEAHYVRGLTDSAAGISIRPADAGVCPEITSSIDIVYEKTPDFFLPLHYETCEPAEIHFDFRMLNVFDSLSMSWDFGNGQTLTRVSGIKPVVFYDNARPNGYNVQVKAYNQWGMDQNAFCMSVKDSIAYVRLHPMPEAAFTADPEGVSSIAMTRFSFTNRSEVRYGAIRYHWDFGETGDKDISVATNPVYTYKPDTGVYRVVLTASFNYLYKGEELQCTDSAAYRIWLGPDVSVFVPNAVNPESPFEENSHFRPLVNGEKTYRLSVFNRWGGQLFEGSDKTKGWDCRYEGQICPQGIYMWVLEVSGMDNKVYRYTGTLTLLR